LGCEKAPNPAEVPLSEQSGVNSLAKASTITTNTVFTFDVTLFVPCAEGGAGEEVHISGPLKELFHVTLDGNGGFHFNSLFNPLGITGVGLTSGDQYQATGETRFSFNDRGLPFEFDFVNNFKIIGHGPGNNFLVHDNVHVTVNANGTVTADHVNSTFDCK
jgi:hypothetical protein